VLVLHDGDATDDEGLPSDLLGDADAVVGTALHPVRVVAEINRLLVEATRAAAVALPRSLESAGTARRLVQRAALAWGAGGAEDTLALLSTELVANAVRHGDGDIDILVRVADEVVRVEVRDSSRSVPRMGRLDGEDESGRGLALVDALSRAWGIEPTDDGKSVWFELDLRD
jgi:anti-sigma regulatory factor (Ser/Thr protein kinase)